MNTLLLVISVSVGVLLLWALIAPRSQWYLLASWSYRDHYADEPGRLAYLYYRIVAALGIIAVAASLIVAHQVDPVEEFQPPPPPPSAAEQMWGSPEPVVVNRVIQPVTKPPRNLVSQPILGYQVLDGQTRQPPYSFSLDHFEGEGVTAENGYIGIDPEPGLVALDTARLVVHVAGDPRCFPHAALVRTNKKAVTVAIYYGQANPPDGSNADHVADCTTEEDAANVSTLIPIPLPSSVRGRDVVTLAGEEIPLVPLITP